MYCGECGAENIVSAQFCKSCGKKLSNHVEPQVKQENINEQHDFDKDMQKFSWGACGIGFLWGIFFNVRMVWAWSLIVSVCAGVFSKIFFTLGNYWLFGALIACCLQIFISIYLGSKARGWAVEGKNAEYTDNFLTRQKYWDIFGAIFFVLFCLIVMYRAVLLADAASNNFTLKAKEKNTTYAPSNHRVENNTVSANDSKDEARADMDADQAEAKAIKFTNQFNQNIAKISSEEYNLLIENYADYKAIENELLLEYRRLLSKLPDEKRSKLIEIQKEWITERDDLVFKSRYDKGSRGYVDALISVTKDRIADFKSIGSGGI